MPTASPPWRGCRVAAWYTLPVLSAAQLQGRGTARGNAKQASAVNTVELRMPNGAAPRKLQAPRHHGGSVERGRQRAPSRPNTPATRLMSLSNTTSEGMQKGTCCFRHRPTGSAVQPRPARSHKTTSSSLPAGPMAPPPVLVARRAHCHKPRGPRRLVRDGISTAQRTNPRWQRSSYNIM
jgi:hypothetical protein